MASEDTTAITEFDSRVDAAVAPKATAPKKAAKKASKPKAATSTSTKKPAAKKPAAKKSKAKPAAQGSKAQVPKAARKAKATKSSKASGSAATAAASAAASAVAKGRSAAAASVPAALAAAPTFITTVIDDINAFDLKANIPALEWPAVEIPHFGKAVADVSALSAKAGDLVTEFLADVTKFGTDAVTSVGHGVTLVREAVGV